MSLKIGRDPMLPHNEILEIVKLMSDLFKQMTTLNTGMVVLIITIVEKIFTTERVFKSRLNKALLVASLSCFIVSLLLSLRALVRIPGNLIEILQAGTRSPLVDNYSFYGSTGFFILGIVLFIILAARNVFSRPAPEQ